MSTPSNPWSWPGYSSGNYSQYGWSVMPGVIPSAPLGVAAGMQWPSGAMQAPAAPSLAPGSISANLFAFNAPAPQPAWLPPGGQNVPSLSPTPMASAAPAVAASATPGTPAAVPVQAPAVAVTNPLQTTTENPGQKQFRAISNSLDQQNFANDLAKWQTGLQVGQAVAGLGLGAWQLYQAQKALNFSQDMANRNLANEAAAFQAARADMLRGRMSANNYYDNPEAAKKRIAEESRVVDGSAI